MRSILMGVMLGAALLAADARACDETAATFGELTVQEVSALLAKGAAAVFDANGRDEWARRQEGRRRRLASRRRVGSRAAGGGAASVPSCLVAGAIAGGFVALRAVREERHWSFWLGALAVTALLGTLGCSVAGGAGVVGLLAGVVAGSAPVLVRAEIRRG